jgi:large subunit ribosomal protein L10
MSEKAIPHREPPPRKVEQVANIVALLDRSSGLVLTDYRGLTVSEKADLTRRLRAVNAEFHVVKNTLFRLAYGDRGEQPGGLLAGPTAICFSMDDPVAPARIIHEFIREKRKGAVKGGIVDGRLFSVDEVKRLSELPGKDQLLGQVVSAIQGPLAGLVFSLQGVLGNFVRTVQAIHDQKAGTAA